CGAAEVFVERDQDLGRVPVDGLVDRVVDDLPEQVVVAARVGAADVHRRALADGLEPLEDFDVFRGIRHDQFSLASSGTVTSGRSARSMRPRRNIGLPLPPREWDSYLRSETRYSVPLSLSATSASLCSRRMRAPTRASPLPSFISMTPLPAPPRMLISSA